MPPLWRDIDAYTQITVGPGPSTILMHGPLYCFAARLPLYLGYLWEDAGSAAVRSMSDFLLAPSLSDAGVMLLLLSQHAALLCAHLYFVVAVSASIWARAMVTVALALNPLAYAFAHSVGSEAPSAIGIIAVTASGFAIIMRSAAPVTRRSWLIFGALVTLMMLTRQVHGLLTLLMPFGFLIAVMHHSLAGFAMRVSRRSPRRHPAEGVLFRRCLIAVAIGAGCVALSNGCVRLISAAADTPYRSRIGFTFMWRLQFLQNLGPEERRNVTRSAASRARSAEAARLIDAIGEAYANPELDISAFLRQERATLFPPGTKNVSARMDALLNELPRAFALGAPSTLVRTAVADFAEARQMTIADLTEFLFWSTAYYFGREQTMPQLGGLSTFRGSDGAGLIALGRQTTYLRLWSGVSLNWWCAAWLSGFGALVTLGALRQVDVVPSYSFAAALMVTGFLIMLAHCFLTELLARYTLPTFQLLFLSLVVLLSRIVEIGTGDSVTSPS